MSLSGKKRGRPTGGGTPAAPKDNVIVLKGAQKGRPKLSLSEKNPEASDLMQLVTGTIGGVKAAFNVDEFVPEIRFTNAIKNILQKTEEKTADYLHKYMTDKNGDREEAIKKLKKEISDGKKKAKYTEDQKKFSRGMLDLNKVQAGQMRQFFILSLKDLEFLALTSEKITPHLEVERLYRSTMDHLNDRKSSSMRDLPQGDTQDTDAQVYADDDAEFEVDDEEDTGEANDGNASDTTTAGAY
jgi:hypothetical protein